MATKILGVYQIIYPGNVRQVKNLISHDDYIKIYKAYQDEIYELEKANKFKESNTTKRMKKELKEFFGSEWFTDKSPIYYAITSGYLSMPKHQGGNLQCSINVI